MSRYYDMIVAVKGLAPERVEAVKAAAEAEWPFEDWDESPEEGLTASAKDHLCGGESEEEFAQRLAVAVWRAHDAYCDVTVHALYLEELPYETHSLTEDDYDRLIAAASGSPTTETGDEDHADRGG